VDSEDELINFNTPWMAAIKEWQNEDISSRDFVDSVRRELLGKRVFVFLRNGKILNLPRGATIVDVAFQIHTEVGLKMHGAEINGKPVAFSYELQNGDSVSILTGKGKPGIDWMRSANSRSTRSKLRAYFRARQRDSFLDAGKIIMRDYLWMHGQLIEQNSRLGKVFTVPTDDVTKLQSFLPGKSQFSDVEDLLVEVGKQRGRESLHTIISQIFSVSKTKLLHAEEQRKEHPRSGGVISAVLGGRRRAQDVAKFLSFSGNSTFSTPRQPPNPSTENEATKTDSFYGGEDLYAYIDTPIELADPEYVCKDCLPVHGDAIIGTRRVTTRGKEAAIPTVHRMACPHAQQALNRAKGLSRDGLNWKNGSSIAAYFPRIDSVSLRGWKTQTKDSGIATTSTTHLSSHHDEVPVRLEWCDYDCESADFLTEVVVVAEDRKLLLSDCSAVVSETVEILKTGSATTNEHATLVFLVKVSCLEDIQILLDKLSRIRSVMSVERRFGSALLQT
jgi:(p)ppGpp synthase/HD superfamily hydrolase